MSKQDRAITERHTKILRELVKRPENKTCSDCKHNDPRWASWNLGVFLCIRCSGIHRGMGTHISKVKSIDLDTWTPEQMESITKWGNRRANLYWEAHLKSGHIPPDHKMESFIRSKYESRRWAMDGPPPSDPAVLESGAPAPAPVPPAPIAPQASAPRSSSSTAPGRPPVTTRQPQAHQLLSTQHARAASTARSAPASAPAPPQPTPPQPPAPDNDLFSLDFHAPPPSSSSSSAASSAPKKDVKQDILSLFSAPAQAAPPPPSAFGTFASAQGPAAHAPSPWATTGGGAGYAQAPAPVPAPAPASAAQAGGNWGVGYGWNAAPAAPAPGDIWGAQTSAAAAAQQLFNTTDIWGGSASASASAGGGAGAGMGGDLFGAPASGAAAAQKKEDVFGDLWGGFK